MQKLNRTLFTIGCVVMIVSTTGCISFFTRPFTAQILDSSKHPVSDAFVMFDYSGFEFPEGSYHVGQSMAKTDKNGKFSIPFYVHFHPLINGGAKPYIEYVYSSTTHSSVGASAFLKETMDERPSIHQVTLPDNKDNPVAWANDLNFAIFFFEFMSSESFVKGGIKSIDAPVGVKKEFVGMLQSEFESYKARFGTASYEFGSNGFNIDESKVQGWQKELQNQP